MATLGLDYAGNSPGSAAVKAAGFSFVARYLSRYSGKVITKGEYDDYTNNGVGVVLVFEDYANQALQGYAQGVADAQVALAQANALGWPSDRPIHFAVDFDINDAQKPAAGQYMQGVISVLGLGRTGAYGGYWWIKYCVDNGLASFFWQAVAWSGGQIHPSATLFQQLGGTVVNGTSCDINQALKTDYGQNGVDNVAIIQNEPNWVGRANKSFQMIRGRDMGPGELEPFVGQDFLHLIEALEDNPEADATQNAQNVGQVAVRDNWQGQINTLTTELATANATITKLQTPAPAPVITKTSVTVTPPVTSVSKITVTPTPAVIKPVQKMTFWQELVHVLFG